MAGPDRKRGILTTDDRDYLVGRKNLQSDSERNARKRIRDRVRNSLYDFEYLVDHLGERDVTQLVTATDGTHEQPFEAAENMIAFIFRMCAHAPDSSSLSTDDRFKEIIQNGIEKGLDDRHELLDFKLNLQHGLPADRKATLMRKIHFGEDLSLTELREALENNYFDESFRFKPLDNDGLPKAVDPRDHMSHDDHPGYPKE